MEPATHTCAQLVFLGYKSFCLCQRDMSYNKKNKEMGAVRIQSGNEIRAQVYTRRRALLAQNPLKICHNITQLQSKTTAKSPGRMLHAVWELLNHGLHL